jgi:hypothetical protein
VNTVGQSVTVSLASIGLEDGWVRESSENSGTGGRVNRGGAGSRAIRFGDDRRDRQLKSILSFDTSSIPDGATTLSAKILLRVGRVKGSDPFNTYGAAMVDVQSGGFSGSTALENSDFDAGATALNVTSLTAPAADNVFSEGVLNTAGLNAINLAGKTQFRIGFVLDDNDDRGADYAGYYSGDNSNAQRRPLLEITYTP